MEVVDVGGDVEGKAVAGHPARNPDANRRQFVVPHPHPSEPLDTAGDEPVIGGGSDERFLEVPHIAVDIAAIRLEVENRVSDDLAGAVVGDVAAAAGLMELDLAGSQFGR